MISQRRILRIKLSGLGIFSKHILFLLVNLILCMVYKLNKLFQGKTKLRRVLVMLTLYGYVNTLSCGISFQIR